MKRKQKNRDKTLELSDNMIPCTQWDINCMTIDYNASLMFHFRFAQVVESSSLKVQCQTLQSQPTMYNKAVLQWL